MQKLYMIEYHILEELCNNIYFHDLSDETVYTDSMLCDACHEDTLRDNGDIDEENHFIGFAGINMQEIDKWKDGNGVYLTYNSYDGNTDTKTLVAQQIVDKCKELNILYIYNNDISKKIYIKIIPTNKPYFYGEYGFTQDKIDDTL